MEEPGPQNALPPPRHSVATPGLPSEHTAYFTERLRVCCSCPAALEERGDVISLV